jgi:hypothetical protein
VFRVTVYGQETALNWKLVVIAAKRLSRRDLLGKWLEVDGNQK